jgi:hypothetical protein
VFDTDDDAKGDFRRVDDLTGSAGRRLSRVRELYDVGADGACRIREAAAAISVTTRPQSRRAKNMKAAAHLQGPVSHLNPWISDTSGRSWSNGLRPTRLPWAVRRLRDNTTSPEAALRITSKCLRSDLANGSMSNSSAA